jgi:hypothetical protein
MMKISSKPRWLSEDYADYAGDRGSRGQRALPYPVHELVVFFVGADPKPDNIVFFAPTYRPVVQTDIDSPHSALLSEAQRALKWIRSEELKFLIS